MDNIFLNNDQFDLIKYLYDNRSKTNQKDYIKIQEINENKISLDYIDIEELKKLKFIESKGENITNYEFRILSKGKGFYDNYLIKEKENLIKHKSDLWLRWLTLGSLVANIISIIVNIFN